ncbi:MAG: GH25 family lysozyme [Bacillota bacterium]|nr:GH25 family lysozyme [Bacillota bacterium]
MRNRKNSKMFSRAFSMFIALVFMVTTIVTPVSAVTEAETAAETEVTEETQVVEAVSTEEVQDEEPAPLQYEKEANSWRYQDGQNITEENTQMMRRSVFTPWTKTPKGIINSNGHVVEGAVRRGIDVSYWQGTIDWDKVKADDVDFAIIRCGYGMDQRDQDDSQFARNVSECERLGIPYGVYIYSYADSVDRAKSEAQHTLRLLREVNADPDYPVYYDMEDDSTLDNTDNDDLVEFARIFCSTIEAAGYDAGIYANLYWWNNYLYDIPSDPDFDMYDKWVAQYNYRCTYDKGEYRLWQCTSSAKIDGIEGVKDGSDLVDVNLEFVLKNETNNCKTEIRIEDDKFVDGYGVALTSQWVSYKGNKYYVNSEGTILKGFNTIDGNKYYFDGSGILQKSKWVTVSSKKYYLTSSGTVTTGYKKIGSYYYYFDSAGVMKTGTITVNKKQYKLTSSGKAVIHTAKIKTKLNYRTGPSTKYKKKGTYKKGKTVSVMRTSNGWSQLTNGYWVKSSYTKKATTYPKTIFAKYKVKTKTKLNYRTGPGTKYKRKGTYKKGKTLTIVAAKSGWGKTSSGYWVKLSYTKKL